jgi:hypothetical protein
VEEPGGEGGILLASWSVFPLMRALKLGKTSSGGYPCLTDEDKAPSVVKRTVASATRGVSMAANKALLEEEEENRTTGEAG